MYLLLKDLVGMAKTAIMKDTFLLGLEANIAKLAPVVFVVRHRQDLSPRRNIKCKQRLVKMQNESQRG